MFAPYDITGNRMAQALLKPHVFQFIDFTTSSMGSGRGHRASPRGSGRPFRERTLEELQLRRESGRDRPGHSQSAMAACSSIRAPMRNRGRRFLVVMGEPVNLQTLERMLTRDESVKILNAAQMREVDRRTIELGIPGIILMENAGPRVVEFMAEKVLTRRRSAHCGLCAARATMAATDSWWRVSCTPAFTPARCMWRWRESRRSCKATPRRIYVCWQARGCAMECEITPEMRRATLVIDAMLGTGLTGPARGRPAELIHEINTVLETQRWSRSTFRPAWEAAGTLFAPTTRSRLPLPSSAMSLRRSARAAGDHVAQIGSPSSAYTRTTLRFSHLVRARRFRELFHAASWPIRIRAFMGTR